ncbi:MAG: NAD(P)H-hydrate epimerase [Chromatiales bacterium 21-64-14]|nr:MAG: NAD(P)H-hydrate epimerase [Chromatiales bacterium 21-64-14]HQU16149.1 NAD(P)H-hydrate epimerase [Gammaproteobacteria bacterium]
MQMPQTDVPCVTAEQMREVDRAMVEGLGIGLIQMMESAGRHLAHLARSRFLDGDPVGRVVTVLAGSGGNGGGALVCARRLHTWGAEVTVVLARDTDAFVPASAHQWEILTRMGVAVLGADAVSHAPQGGLIVDGILGYSLAGAPRGASADLVRWANGCATTVLALDVPSGVDAGCGTVYDPAIRATATLTLALPKCGLFSAAAAPYVGELYLADIGVPAAVYQAPSLGLTVGPLFAREEIIRLS